MQSSTWNDTNQHWIPQFLLKGFGIKGQSSKVYELDKETGDIQVRRVADAASKQRLLTERDDDFMMSIEQETKNIVHRLRKGYFNLREKDRLALDELVYAVIVNDPYSGADIETTRSDVINSQSNKLIEAIWRQGGTVNPDTVKKFVGVRLNHDHLHMAMNREHNLVLKALNYMELRVYRPVNGEAFIIGDSPVLIVRGTVNGVTSLLYPGSQVILPIHSRCVLGYRWDSPVNMPRSGTVLDQEQVRSLNKDYYHNSNSRCLFARMRGSLEVDCLPKTHQTNTATQPSNVSESWWNMQEKLMKIAADRAAEDAQVKRDVDAFANQVVRKAEADINTQMSENA